MVVVELDEAAERHDLQKVQREDAEGGDQVLVEGRVWDSEDDAQLVDHLNERDEGPQRAGYRVPCRG